MPSSLLLLRSCNFSSVEVILTMGTKNSGLVFASNLEVILSSLISNIFANSVIFSLRFSVLNFEGWIPTTESCPSSANIFPFLSNILPLIWFEVFT